MARNVSQKDQTLNEIIDWCEQLEAEGLRLASALLMQHDMAAYGVVKGQVNAYEKTADHCRSMLGYTGNMPTEVPNQSEDGIPPVSYCPRCGALIWPDTTQRCINGQPENDAEYYRRILEIYKNNPDPLFCHNCGQRFKYVGQDQLAYKHQSNRADILHTLKLKAETQPTFDLAELNQ